MYLLSLAAIIFNWYAVSLGHIPNLDFIVIGLSILFIISMDFRNLAHVMFMIGFLIFVMMPVASIHDLIFINPILVLALCFSTLLFLWFARNSTIPVFQKSPRGNPALKLALVVCLALISIAALGVSGLMITPLVFVSFFYLIQGVKFGTGFAMLSITIIYIIVYALFFWSGFGRLILASWLMVTLWIFWHQYSIPFGKLMVFAPILGGEYILSALGSTRRAFAMREQFLTGSVGSDLSPFLFANNFANSDRAIDISGLINQYILYFLQWVPRGFWPDKPLGFGFEYTVQNYGPGMIAAEHSIAATHVGEHLYYLNDFGYVTSFFTILLLAISYRFLLKYNSRAPFLALVFAMYLPTFVWGGMASFMSRVWIGVVILIFLYVVLWLLRVFSRSSYSGLGGRSA